MKCDQSEQLLSILNPGEMIYLLDEAGQTIFLIREEKSALVPGQDNHFAAWFQAGVFQVGQVYIAALMIQTVDRLYESWCNWRDPDDRLCLEQLSRQPTIVLQYLIPQPATPKRVGNGFRDFAQQALRAATEWPHWSPDTYQRARSYLEWLYPSPEALWNRLTSAAQTGIIIV